MPGLGAGGTERVVSIIANGWAERGWDVSIFAFAPANETPYYALHPKIAVCRLGLPPSPYPALQAMLATARRIAALRKALRQLSPDIVVSFLTRTNVKTIIATAGMDVPVVVSERNNPELQDVGIWWNWLRARTYPRAFGLVTMTKGALEFIPETLRQRGWVIPNPVIHPNVPARRPGNGVLTAVGRLVPQKGFDILLSAFAEVAPAFPEWKLVIWGDGPERANLEKIRDRLDLGRRVELPGLSARPGLWMETADAFVLSSRFEGWGNALTEAMAAGLPVVSFDCPWGPRDMIEDGVDGLLVPRDDGAALAKALATLLGDAPLRQRLGAAASASARRFDPERIIELWNDVVNSAIEMR
ncbi:MAG: glycosyltransferase family 4 protein [Aestuariivirga sp.]